MSTSAPASRDLPATSPLDAFRGTFPPTKTGPLYRAGLVIVTLAMVLLPVVYLGLVVVAAWGVFWHLRHDTWLFSGGSGRGGFVRLILYLGPAVAGGILVFFMVKPFFAARAKTPEPITLDPEKEPLLFAFVQKICSLVGAPPPGRIDVDCQVNASASLRRGAFSKDLVLTIGLPLVSGLDMRQFAGVLAHEFGHFAQGAGMRLTYVIRKINFWFARVVYERDAWDLKLEGAARGTDLRIGVMFHLARGCVWLTRRILWGLMHAGHAISCFMLRQMEYDADSYEAKLAGSDAFEATASRLRLLSVATNVAYEDVRQSWTDNRLPENLPLLIDYKAASLPTEIRQKLSDAAAAGKTGWFDTHPCDADRARAVRTLNEAGVFHLAEPATRLFADFAGLSKTVTRHQYEKHFELEFTDQNLMSADEILRTSEARVEAEASIRKFFGDVNIALKPLLTSAELPSIGDRNSILPPWHKARQAAEQLRGEAEKLSTECLEQHRRRIELTSAHRLAAAGFRMESKAFGLPIEATSAEEQELAARSGLDEAATIIADRLARLEPFMAALRQRVTLALQDAQLNATASGSEKTDEAAGLIRLLIALGESLPRAHEMTTLQPAFTLLLQNSGSHAEPAKAERAASEVGAELRALAGQTEESLKPFAYPFPHARSPLSVAEYLRSERPAENEWHRIHLDSHTHVDRLFTLNFQVVGRILALADAAEKTMEGRAGENGRRITSD